MFYGYPDDERSWTVDDQYLFGPDLLVAPVVQAGARERDVYLPGKGTWTELHSGRVFVGGRVLTADHGQDVVAELGQLALADAADGAELVE